MSTSKHAKARPEDLPRDDLEDDPGIGQSKGTQRPGDIDDIRGDNTVEGDVGNDVTPQGGVRENQVGRANK